jgi:hypothetical protein
MKVIVDLENGWKVDAGGVCVDDVSAVRIYQFYHPTAGISPFAEAMTLAEWHAMDPATLSAAAIAYGQSIGAITP